MSALAARLGQLSWRERALLAAAAAVTAAVLAGRLVVAVRDDLAALRARVAAHERELARVRRAAVVLQRAATSSSAAERSSLVARVEGAAVGVVARERIAALTPSAGPVADGLAEERVELRVGGASLAETVELVHTLEGARPPLRVARLELRKHPDDVGRFEATIELVELRPAP